MRAIERPGLRLRHAPAWLQGAEVDTAALLRQLQVDLPWQQPTVTVYGRRHLTPRLTCWVADPGCSYRYSGLDQVITPWSPPLEKLRDRLEQVLGLRFNSLLLNRYRTGADRMGWHADDEPELDPRAPIASLSLGAARTFQLRPRRPIAGEERALSVELADGDLLLMEPPTQEHWLHQVPVRRRVGNARVNLTFRRFRQRP